MDQWAMRELSPAAGSCGPAPSAMKHPDDFYAVVEVVSGEQVMSAADAFGCHLGPSV